MYRTCHIPGVCHFVSDVELGCRVTGSVVAGTGAECQDWAVTEVLNPVAVLRPPGLPVAMVTGRGESFMAQEPFLHSDSFQSPEDPTENSKLACFLHGTCGMRE